MSMAELFKNYQPVENPEFGQKKKLIGDAVAQVVSLEKMTAKSGAEWVIFKCEAIHPIADPKGRETTVSAGDELTKVYDPSDEESMQDLANDLFTAGIEFSKDTDDDAVLVQNMAEAAKGKLVYFRTWVKDKTEEQKAKNPNKAPYFQNCVVKSARLITEENSQPVLPF
jgi:hypothetical protein